MTEPVYDIHGYPIEPGDVLRSFHYRYRRRLYLYHVAVGPPVPTRTGAYLRAEPAAWLHCRNEKEGGSFLLTPSTAAGSAVEIVQGLSRSDSGELLHWFERPKRNAAPINQPHDPAIREVWNGNARRELIAEHEARAWELPETD